MAEVRSAENEPEKTQQNIELTEKEQAQKQAEEKNNTSSTPKEAKIKSTKLKLRFSVKLLTHCFKFDILVVF